MVKEQLDLLATWKSPGADDIHPKLLFELEQFLAEILTNFKQILRGEEITERLEISSHSIHLQKRHEITGGELSPRKPDINSLQTLQKIYPMEHLNGNEIFVNEQFGLLHGRMSQLKFLRVLDDFTETIDRQKEMDVVYLDFEKAFDTTPN